MYTRLSELREREGYSQNECAKKAFISLNSYIRYEHGKRIVPLDVAVQFAKIYNVSIDYIANITDEEKPYKKKEMRK
ncbi:MAG: helix-turn-helix transcriptional regulator [Oscillospiraceae bacterium]|nr:helix-turn-helix transcriptional regulator [Oscillospiraceae bacterium]